MKVDIKDQELHCYVDWMELVKKYQAIFTDKDTMPSSGGKIWANRIKDGDRFYDVDSETMLDRIKNGYEFAKVDLANMPTVTYDRPRPRYTDNPEGEFDNDLFNSGETEYFLSKPKKKSVGGIRLKVQIGFTARVNNKVMQEYFAWTGQTIQAIQARGFDIELSVFNQNPSLYPSMRNSYQNIRISKFGERVMLNDWSALFSPGAHRHFMFLLYRWAGDQEKVRYEDHTLGRSIGRSWRIEWDSKNRAMVIHVDSQAGYFPAEQLTNELEQWEGK